MSRLLSIALFLVLSSAIRVDAFVIQTGRTTTGQILQLHWPDQIARAGIPFAIDGRGSRDIPDKEAVFNAFREGFRAWSSQPLTFVRFDDRGILGSPVTSSQDRQNVLTFDETGAQIGAPADAGVVAITRVNSDDRTGEIFDADILFNGRDFRFSVGDPSSVRPPFVDLQDVATHEIGHLLGIDHTGLTGPPLRRPTMNPFTNREAPGAARALKPDDIAAVGSLYPSEAFTGTGRISGTVLNPDGTGTFGVQVVAYDESGAFVISGLSGYRTGRGGGGEYALVGLPPGRYTVGIEPLKGSVTSANFSGLFRQPFNTDFPPEFYDNISDPSQAEPLRVQAGQEIPGIHFFTGLFIPGFPAIQNLVLPANTPDPAGPYAVQAVVSDDRGLSKVTLFYRVGAGSYAALTMRSGLSGSYAADIPGQGRGTSIEYYIEATDTEGHTSTYPTGNAPPLRLKVLDLTGKPMAYVALRKSNAVSVLDTGVEPPAEVARISVGEDPIGLVITPDERLVCVSNRVSGTVTLIETATHRAVATVPVGREPVNLAASPDGRSLYVNNTLDNSVSVIDLNRREHVRRIPVRVSPSASPPGPYGIAVSPDGKRLYVTVMNENAVVVLDPASGAETARIPVVAQPRSLALSPDGKRLYVTGLADGAGISVVNTATNQVDARISVSATAKAFGVAVSPDGRTTYVTDYTNNLLFIDAATGQVRQVIPVPGQNTRGIAVSADGASIYVANQDSDDLLTIDAATGRILRTIRVAQGPRDIAFRNRPIQAVVDPNAIAASDFDGDGLVDLSDFFLFAAAFGTSTGQSGFEPRFDLNRDNQIGFSDFFLFADLFGRRSR
ncbi:MAG: matrixin family metalloprotease [Candidatus Latescibacteria bacterium]|nr:matrixin family metalloprotease [Candidatus Latescibacterota bacterium]